MFTIYARLSEVEVLQIDIFYLIPKRDFNFKNRSPIL
jgi:hypothetical protein